MSGERILIVEPNTTLLKNVAEQVLLPNGFRPLTANGRSEGLKIARSTPPNLLLLHLPLDSSVNFLHSLPEEIRQDLPAILMIEEGVEKIAIDFFRLGVRDYIVHPFTSETLLKAVDRVLAEQAALKESQLLANDLSKINRELEQRLKEFEKVYKIGRSISSTLDLNSVLNRVTEAAVYLTDAEEGYLLLLDSETNRLKLRAAQNFGEKKAQGFSVAVTDSIAGTVVRSGRPMLLGGDKQQTFKVKTGHLVKSLLNVPLKTNDGQVIGVLGVDNQLSNVGFSTTHLYQLSALSEIAAIALVNAGQHTETRKKLTRRVKEFATLQALSGQLSAVNEFEVGAQLILSLVLKATNAEAGVLIWIEHGKPEQLPRYVSQGSLGDQVFHYYADSSPEEHWWDTNGLKTVIETGKPIIKDDVNQNGIFSPTQNHGQNRARSRLVVPMRRGKHVLGAINLESTIPGAFNKEDLYFVSGIADQAAIALEGTVLYEKAEITTEQLTRLMETVNNAIWLVDKESHLIAYNRVAGKLMGWFSKDLIGKPIADLLHLENGDSYKLCRLFSAALQKKRVISVDEPLRIPQKGIIKGGRIMPIIQKEKIVGAVGAFWTQPTETFEKQLEVEFANMASHLFRTPLSFIQTSIDLLMESNLEFEEQQAMLDRMREHGQHLTETTNELLKILRLETEGADIQAKAVYLPPLINRVLELVQLEDPRYTFTKTFPEKIPVVFIDSTKTELILLNLLLSAIRRCKDGGIISIKAHATDNEVIIAVSDNGEAVSAKLLERIFEQFYPVDDEGGKVPTTYYFGLYTTKRLVELQKGRIWAENQPESGIQVSFSLPRWEENR